MKNLRFCLLLLAAAASPLAFASAPASAEYESGWDSTYNMFKMDVRIHLDPTSGGVVIDAGTVQFKDNSSPLRVLQGNSMPGRGGMAGVVSTVGNGGALMTAFGGSFAGTIGSGTLSATNVTIPHGVRAYTTSFTLTCVPGTLSGGSAPAPVTVTRLNPVGLTPQQQQLIAQYNANRPTLTLASPAPVLLLDNTNSGGVSSGPAASALTDLVLSSSTEITEIWTYHWNNGRGEAPGTIALRDGSGRIYGPWGATASSGSNNAPNVNWDVKPNVTVPAGIYAVVDSSASTWSQNAMSHQEGFAKIWGIKH